MFKVGKNYDPEDIELNKNHQKFWNCVHGHIVGFAIVEFTSETVEFRRFILIDPKSFQLTVGNEFIQKKMFGMEYDCSALESLFNTIFWNLRLPDIQINPHDIRIIKSTFFSKRHKNPKNVSRDYVQLFHSCLLPINFKVF